MKRFQSTFLVLFTFLVFNTGFAQLSSSEVDVLVENALKEFNVAGTAVAIVKDGKIIHSKGYGYISVDSKKPVNKFTSFAIASNSKAFTTAALAMLEEEGKIKWDDKVKAHSPEFTMYNAYVTENFSIVDLLTHRSGLSLGIGDLMWVPDGSNFTIDDLLNSFQYFKPVSAFRTQYDYDNLLYFVAGELIERVSGMPWEEFVQKRIFNPLKMNQSYTSISNIKDFSNIAVPHTTETGPIRTTSHYEQMMNGAAAGIVANVDDLSHWMLLHLNKGKYGNDLKKQLFSEESQQKMWQVYTPQKINKNPRYNSHFAGYGLGWGLTDLNGNLSVSHTGGLPGMLSKTILIPDLNLGVVVLTNTSNGGAGVFSAVSKTIVDSYLGLEDNDWTTKYLEYFTKQENEGNAISKKVWETVAKASHNKINIEDYIGVYKDNWFGKVTISLKNGKLWFTSHRSPKLNGPMAYYKANTFAIKWEYQDMNGDAFAMFSLDEEGKAQRIKMKGISPNIDFSFDFQDLDLQRVE